VAEQRLGEGVDSKDDSPPRLPGGTAASSGRYTVTSDAACEAAYISP